MTEQVLDILKLALLGLLYLFFARVLWAVWSEVRSPASANGLQRTVDPTPAGMAKPSGPGKRSVKPPAGRKGVPARLEVLEPEARRGVVYAIDATLTFGRDVSNTVVIDDDTYLSGHHLRVIRTADGVTVEDLGSRNGTFLNGTRLSKQHSLATGDRIQLGYTVLEAQ